MDARNRHNHFMPNRPQAVQPLHRQLFRHVLVVPVNRSEHRHEEWNKHDDYPCPMNEFGSYQDYQNDKSSGRAEAVDDDRFLPVGRLFQFTSQLALIQFQVGGGWLTCAIILISSVSLFIRLPGSFQRPAGSEPVLHHPGL